MTAATQRERETAALAFPPGHPQAEEVADALVRARAAETLVDLYDAWLRLRVAQAASGAARAEESERLETRASFLLKSVESARALQPAQPAQAKRKGKALKKAEDPYAGFLAAAEAELTGARRALHERAEREEELFRRETATLQATIVERVEAILGHRKPAVEVFVQPVGSANALCHLARPGEEEAVLLLSFVLSGKLPTRYDAFFDDSVDDLALPPARFYEEDGASARPASVDVEDAIVSDPARAFVPVKGMIAFRLPEREFPRFRLINRGPLAELEARESAGAAYSHLVSREAAELLTGYFIRLQVEGRLELALKIG
ncbi:MAG: hypothetical protein ACOX6T_12170 [Myxococcales bacterium]